MCWTTARAAVDHLLRSGWPDVELAFSGGEPLLEFGLIQRVVRYAKRAKAADTVVRFGVTTNGMALSDEVATFLERYRFDVELSFDGVPAAQDWRGRGTFAVLDRRLDDLKARHPRLFGQWLTIAVTLHPDTVASLPDAVRYFLSKDVSSVVVNPVQPRDASWRPERIDEIERAFGEAVGVCLDHRHRTGRVPLLNLLAAQATPRMSAGRLPMCAAGLSQSIADDVDGTAHVCALAAGSYSGTVGTFMRESLAALRVGGVDDEGLATRVAAFANGVPGAPVFGDKRRKHSSYGRCRDCEYLDRCSVCPLSIARVAASDDLNRVPDFVCAFNRVSIACRDRFGAATARDAPRPPDDAPQRPRVRRPTFRPTSRPRQG
jgi:sulfatase maturation enzyme AslB (radical SAM superfamily)